MWRRIFWYFATSVLKKNVEDAGCRFFQTSGTLLQKFQRKMLKMKAADSSKILVHFYKRFEGNC
jgi:DNA-binding transcriptional regulator PaaX